MNEQQIEKVSHIASLIVGDMQDKLTPDQRQELNAWLQENGDNFLLYEDLMDEDKLGASLNELNAYDHKLAYEKLAGRLFPAEVQGKRVYFRIWWYMVAAVLVLVTGGIAYFALNKKADQSPPRLVVVAQKKAPGVPLDSKKAILLLTDGSAVTLNEMNNGDIAQQGNVVVHKNKNGQLEYKLSTPTASTNEVNTPEFNTNPFNTLRTPRGGEYQIVLDDGTRIWLNSASTLQFPIHFNGNERRVTLTGEAYFEVASLPLSDSYRNSSGKPSATEGGGGKRPFIVYVNNMEVQAVGTAFNISAYKEDEKSQTTVVEGLVKVSRNNQTSMLPPGKKYVVSDTSFSIEDADVNQDIAWKNGEFVFKNTSLKMVMNEIARWYDKDVAYDPGVPSLHFSGEIQRASDITQVLQMLEYTGGVTFTIANRIITVHAGKK